MFPDPRSLAAALLCAALASAPAEAGDARAPHRLCPEDAPEGVRLPPQPGCAATTASKPSRDDGFRDLGGVKLRVGGRVGAEYGTGR